MTSPFQWPFFNGSSRYFGNPKGIWHNSGVTGWQLRQLGFPRKSISSGPRNGLKLKKLGRVLISFNLVFYFSVLKCYCLCFRARKSEVCSLKIFLQISSISPYEWSISAETVFDSMWSFTYRQRTVLMIWSLFLKLQCFILYLSTQRQVSINAASFLWMHLHALLLTKQLTEQGFTSNLP